MRWFRGRQKSEADVRAEYEQEYRARPVAPAETLYPLIREALPVFFDSPHVGVAPVWWTPSN